MLASAANNQEQLNDLQFIQRVLLGHLWPEEVKAELTSSISKLKAKYADKKLNVSVIGEFSTGKSTFINALLRTDLLASGSLQGTTVASTILEYGKDYTVTVVGQGNKKSCTRYANLEQMREALSHTVAANAEAQNIHTVCVTLPTPALHNTGLRIVDTPGTDATELWHEDVTVRAIEELSDLSVVLINATKALPESFCEFIDENLGNILDRCVFVVTKLDLVKEKERPMVMQYIKMKLTNTFGLENPKVLPYFSAEVIGTVSDNPFAKGIQRAVDISEKAEKIIRDHSYMLRKRIQRQKMVKLMEQLYDAIGNQLHTVSQAYQQKLNIINRSRSADLNRFMEVQRSVRVRELYAYASEQKTALTEGLNRLAQNTVGRILHDINSTQCIEALESYLQQGIYYACQEGHKNRDFMTRFYCNQVIAQREAEMYRFRDDFGNLYSDLELLMTKLEVAPNQIAPPVISAQNLSQAIQQLVRRLPKRKKTDFQTTQAEIKTQLAPALWNFFNQSTADFLRVYDGYIPLNHQFLLQEMNRYLVTYRAEVNRRIHEEEQAKAAVENRIAQLEQDKQELIRRQRTFA